MAGIEVRCTDSVFAGISGRVGNFVFRAYEGGKMLVFYQPKRKKGEKVLSKTDRDWTENGPIMDEFRRITEMFHLEVVK